MLQRIFIHISLVLLFALTQMGVVSHQISHLSDSKQTHQQDKKSHESQCSQCLSYNHASTASVVEAFYFDTIPADHIYSATELSHSPTTSACFYSARAPPFISHV